ncbi:MAG: hypothetical protein CVV03_09430 [Firmicutes bacterium HGW-Firmicutes-8]|nr:MAG: hypothetical protein CVV03_09430 [Firmicutes bacterium HGW-Firmicutes-8]
MPFLPSSTQTSHFLLFTYLFAFGLNDGSGIQQPLFSSLKGVISKEAVLALLAQEGLVCFGGRVDENGRGWVFYKGFPCADVVGNLAATCRPQGKGSQHV